MKKVWIYWLLSLLLAITCTLINQHNYRINDIVKLEFSNSAAALHQNIMNIGNAPANNYYILKMNTIIDYGFIVCYSFLTFISFVLFLDVFQLPIKKWVYILSFMVGFFDVIENWFLLKTAITQQEYYSTIFFWAVRLKWAFTIMPLLLVPIVFVYGLVLLFSVKQS